MLRASLVAAVWPLAAIAQDVLAPSATPPDELPRAPAALLVPSNNAPRPRVRRQAPPNPPFIELMGIGIRPQLQYRYLYAEGLPVGPGRPGNGYVRTYIPGMRFDLGQRWRAEYSPTWTTYTNPGFRDTLDHGGEITGLVYHGDWAATFRQAYRSSSAPLISTSRQTFEESVTTSVTGAYRLGAKTTIDGTASQNLRFVEAFSDPYEWQGAGWIRHQFADRLDLAAGLSGGYLAIRKSSDLGFARPQIRLHWSPTEKVDLIAQAGYERRWFFAANSDPLDAPVYDATLRYTPFEQTRLTLGATRQIEPSLLRNQATETPSWSVGIDQRLLGHVRIGANWRRQEVTYVTASGAAADQRVDNQKMFDASLRVAFLRRAGLAVVYRELKSTANVPGLNVDSRQIGFELEYRY